MKHRIVKLGFRREAARTASPNGDLGSSRSKDDRAVNVQHVVALLVLLLPVSVVGQTAFNWGTPTTATGDSDVSIAGSLVWAYAFASPSPYTVNGVTFSQFGVSDLSTAPVSFSNETVWDYDTNPTGMGFDSVFDGGDFPFLDLSENYQGLLTSAVSWSMQTIRVTFTGLNAGGNYLVQLWVNDSRNIVDVEYRTQSLIDGFSNTVQLAFNSVNVMHGVGQFTNATFVAGPSGEAYFDIQPGTGYEPPAQINAMQLRLVAVPEPAVFSVSVGVMAIAALAIHRRGR